MENKLHCSECGTVIEGDYFKCLDNLLQVKFFDTEEENCFCLVINIAIRLTSIII